MSPYSGFLSLNRVHRPPYPLLKFHKSTTVICHISGCKPVDMTQIDDTLPSVTPACQMAGGLQSPDIHQCLAVRCSHSSVLTLRLVQQTSLPCSSIGATRAWSNDATKWGAIACEQLEIWPIWHSFPIQLCNSVPLVGVVNAFHGQEKMCGLIQICGVPVAKYFQGLHKPH